MGKIALANGDSRLSSDSTSSYGPSTPVDDSHLAANSKADDLDDSMGADAVMPDEAPVRKLDFCSTPSKPKIARIPAGEPVQVFLRVRPLIVGPSSEDMEITEGMDPQELEHRRRLNASFKARADKLKGVIPTVAPVSDTAVSLTAPEASLAFKNGESSGTYSFTRVFGPDATQDDVFKTTTQSLVSKLFRGNNGLVFAYGVTNSGKTYTMQGTRSQPGIMTKLLQSVFARIDRARAAAAGADIDADAEVDADEDNDWLRASELTVEASFLEIYQEKLYDLLAPATSDKRVQVRLMTNGADEVYAHGLKQVRVGGLTEALSVIEGGLKNRVVAQTLLNADSSRSHSVFTVRLVTPGGGTWGRLSVCDLAGAERSSKTGHSSGTRLKETNNINASLMQLGRCLEAVRFNQLNPRKEPKVVPFRDSKLTFLFRDVLTGNGSLTMICNVNPTPSEYDETVHTLKYAAVARDIRVAARIDTKRPGTGRRTHAMSRFGTGTVTMVADEEAIERAVTAATAGLVSQLSTATADRDAAEEAAAEHRDAAAEAERRADALLEEVYVLRRERVRAAEREVEVEEATRAQVWEEMEAEIERERVRFEQRLESELSDAEARMQRRLLLMQQQVLATQTDVEGARAREALEMAEAAHAAALAAANKDFDRTISQERQRLAARLQAAETARAAAVEEAAAARADLDDARAEAASAAATIAAEVEATRAEHAQRTEALITQFEARLRRKDEELAALQGDLEAAQTGALGGLAAEVERAQLQKQVRDGEALVSSLRKDNASMEGEIAELRAALAQASARAAAAEHRAATAAAEATAARGIAAAAKAKQMNPRRLTECLMGADDMALLPADVQDALRADAAAAAAAAIAEAEDGAAGMGFNVFGIEDSDSDESDDDGNVDVEDDDDDSDDDIVEIEPPRAAASQRKSALSSVSAAKVQPAAKPVRASKRLAAAAATADPEGSDNGGAENVVEAAEEPAPATKPTRKAATTRSKAAAVAAEPEAPVRATRTTRARAAAAAASNGDAVDPYDFEAASAAQRAAAAKPKRATRSTRV